MCHPLGNPQLSPEEERRFRKDMVKSALTTLEVEVKEPTVF